MVIDAFRKLFLEFDNITLTLLGKNEERIEYPCEYGNEEKLITFPNRVPRDVYDHHLENADFIIVPSLEKAHTINMTDERYGYTKSPNVNDAIKFRKPLIIPVHTTNVSVN